MDSYFHRVQQSTPTRFWINNVTRQEADLALSAGAVGCTQNPAFSWKILNGSEDAQYAADLVKQYIAAEDDDTEVLVRLQRTLIGNIAQHFIPLYEKTHGRWGYVSIQGSPTQEDAESIIRFAPYNREAAPNIMANRS